MGNLFQRRLSLMAKIQLSNRRPHRFHRQGADCGVESAEQRFVSKTSNQTGPETVPKKVKLDIRKLASALAVFAVDDFGFRGMQFQTTLCQAGLKLGSESFCFLLASAVYQSSSRPGESLPQALTDLDMNAGTLGHGEIQTPT
jgi:hypothetical protein